METAEKIHVELRNYLISNKIPLVFINFKKSLIREEYTEKPYAGNYQILLLEKPDPHAFEIESLEWTFQSEKVLLIYDCSTKEISCILLDFYVELSDKRKHRINLLNYQSLKVCENHLMLTTTGRDEKKDSNCCDIVLFTMRGKFVFVWKMENINVYKTEIDNFHQLAPNYWISKFSVDKRENHKPAYTRLCLLSTKEIEVNRISLMDEFNSPVGSLLASKTSEISSWFSEETNEKGGSLFFVLASHYQCCIYRYDKKLEHYDKIADITLENSFIDDVDVELTEESINIKFDNGRTLVKSGSFQFSFEK